MSVIRTPAKTVNSINDLMMEDFESFESPLASSNRKRPAEKSNDDLYEILKNIMTDIAPIKKETQGIKNEIASAKEELKQQIDGIQTKVINIETNMQEMSSKIEIAGKTAEDAIKIAQDSKMYVTNMLMQSKLEACMDITGIDKEVQDKKRNLNEIVKSTMNSFGILLKEGDITHVERRDIKINRPNETEKIKIVVMVKFKDLETKLRVMKAKNKVRDTRGIYFSITMTKTNRYLDTKARLIARKKGLKTYFAGGFVRVKLPDEKIMIIDSSDKLKELEDYVNELPMNVSPNSSL